MPHSYNKLDVDGILSQDWLHEYVHTLTINSQCEFDEIYAPHLKKLVNYNHKMINVSSDCIVTNDDN